MARETTRNLRVGIIVILSTLLLITALYLIGDKQNLFGSTFRISAKFYNVNGLMQGNNVRLSGINVGTVENVEIVADSSVNVVMLIEKRVQPFIKKNAIASVGTDGLMGNKLVEINSVKEDATGVEEGDELETMRPVEVDDMVRTLKLTNDNIQIITSNLRLITDKINSKNSLWSLLMDTGVAENVKSAVVNIKLMTNQSVEVTGNLKEISSGLKNGKGTLGALITDTLFSSHIRQTIVKIEKFSDSAATITGDLSKIVNKIKNGQGSIGVLLNDTMLIYNLNKGISSIDSGALNFNQNMKALKTIWPLKKYFNKTDK